MIKAKPATNLQPVYFDWDRYFRVLIKATPQAILQRLINASGETTFNGKHQKVTETDWAKFGKAFLLDALAGWEGMTYSHLLEICKPIDPDPGIKLDDPIEFSQENLRFVVENYRPEFLQFTAHGSQRLDEIYAEQKKAELENLSNASGGN